MSVENIKAFLENRAPDIEVTMLDEPHTTEVISRKWKVHPAQVAKALTMKVAGEPLMLVSCGDSRLDNRKTKDVFGGKAKMLPSNEAAELTGHPVGAITPLCMTTKIPVYFDKGLKEFGEVVTSGGSTHAAIRIPPLKFAELVDAVWVDVCK